MPSERKTRIVVQVERTTTPVPRPRAPGLTERITMRSRPAGPSILRQTLDEALFLHWRVPVDALRGLVPPPLSVDTFQGAAWVGITALTVRDSHPSFTPPLLWIADFEEVTVRTYVHLDGVPGVWFFSLDTNSAVTALAGKTFFHLPYVHSDVVREVEGKRIHCRSSRTTGGSEASLAATWTPEECVFEAEPGSLEFFWAERYCLYSAGEDALYRARISHQPWPLRKVALSHCETTLLAANRIAVGGDRRRPRLLAGGPVEVEIWPLERLGRL